MPPEMPLPSEKPTWLHRAAHGALDAIFPPRCAGCQAFEPSLFCSDCARTLQPIQMPFCLRCGLPFDPLAHAASECADCRSNRYHKAPPFDGIRAAYTFEGALRPAVYSLKYRGKIAFAPPLSVLLWRTLQNDALLSAQNFAALCPVPLHSWRRWRRGYNQSALLAEHLSQRSQIPCLELLKRTRRTPPQVGLNEKQRLENVQGAFALNDSLVFDFSRGPILLIDDVCTTGATLAECARVLKSAGAAHVFGLTLARQL